jgi:type IV secretion system protein VirB4
MVQAIGSSRFALYHHIIRRRVVPRVERSFPDRSAPEVDEKVAAPGWNRSGCSRTNCSSASSGGRCRARAARPNGLARLFGKATRAGRLADLAAERRANSIAARDALLAALSEYGAGCSARMKTRAGPCSEPLEYLSALYNHELRPVLLPDGDVGHYLPYRRVSFGARTVELVQPAITSAASSAWSRSRNIPVSRRRECSTN